MAWDGMGLGRNGSGRVGSDRIDSLSSNRIASTGSDRIGSDLIFHHLVHRVFGRASLVTFSWDLMQNALKLPAKIFRKKLSALLRNFFSK